MGNGNAPATGRLLIGTVQSRGTAIGKTEASRFRAALLDGICLAAAFRLGNEDAATTIFFGIILFAVIFPL